MGCESYGLMRIPIALAALALAGCDAGAAENTDRAVTNKLAAGPSFSCTSNQVWDGDSFTCSSGTQIRVAGIAAREVRSVRGGAVVDAGCRSGHPCPRTSGIAARNALAGLFGGSIGLGLTGICSSAGLLCGACRTVLPAVIAFVLGVAAQRQGCVLLDGTGRLCTEVRSILETTSLCPFPQEQCASVAATLSTR